MDVKTALINGDLEEVIYMEHPPRFAVFGQEHLEIFKRYTGFWSFVLALRGIFYFSLLIF